MIKFNYIQIRPDPGKTCVPAACVNYVFKEIDRTTPEPRHTHFIL